MGIVGSVWVFSQYHWLTSRWWYIRIWTWHWLFYINIPIAIIAIILVIWTFHFPEEETVAKSKFDTKGLRYFMYLLD